MEATFLVFGIIVGRHERTKFIDNMINSGLTTFEEIAFNQLMPWSTPDYENNRYREILRLVDNNKEQNSLHFFAALADAYNTLKLPLGKGLLQEWQMFSKLERGRTRNKIAGMLVAYRHNCPKVRFYLLLTGHATQSCLLYIHQTLFHYSGLSFRKYFLGRTLAGIQASLLTQRACVSDQEEDLLIVKIRKLGLAAIFLELFKKYGSYTETRNVRIEKQQLIDILAGINMSDEKLGGIAKQLIRLHPEYCQRHSPVNQNGKKNPGCGSKATGDDQSLKAIESMFRDRQNVMPNGLSRQEKISPSSNNSGKTSQAGEDLTKIPERIGSGEVMKILGIKRATLKSYRDKEHLPFARPNPQGKISYLRSDVMQLLQNKNQKKSLTKDE